MDCQFRFPDKWCGVNGPLDIPLFSACAITGYASLSDKERLYVMCDAVRSSANFAEIHNVAPNLRALDFKQVPMNCHHDNQHGNNVKLYYKPFDDFVQQCKTITLTRTDSEFVTQLAHC